MLKKTLLAAVVATGSIMTLAPLAAQAQTTTTTTVVRIAPPSPVNESMPSPREGFVWAPGHHEWRNGQYVWVQGHWLPERRGYAYVAPRWVQRGNGEWHMVGNNWERGPYGDRDHDGIANRDDPDSPRNQRYARRFGPYGDLDRDGIINRDDRDRDGDGIRNHRDRYPDDRTRS
jgi:hypothetical protein